MIRWLVFSDLDGTLLDESYDWQTARPALEAMQSRYSADLEFKQDPRGNGHDL